MKDFVYNYKAPCYLVCGYNVDEVWRNDLDGDRESGDIDVSIVITVICQIVLIKKFRL